MVSQPEQLRIQLPLETVEAACRQFDVITLWVFGSALRDDFRASSDVDFMARFHNDDLGPWSSKLQGFETALTEALGRKVDVLSRRSVERSSNTDRRQHILKTARLVYEQG